jgi:FkbM family methyltransferase
MVIKKLEMLLKIFLIGKTILQRISPFYLIFERRRSRFKKVLHNGHSFSFLTPNPLCSYRADSFSTKEPDTLAWIDGFKQNSVFWDIGANVGLYSIYAAKTKKCSVVSFEPSIFNLEILARNIFLNNLNDSIQIMPIALSNRVGVGALNMSSTDLGGALSSFDQLYGFNGKNLNIIFKFSTLSMTMDSIIEQLKLSYPKYIKIDVDGIEHLILEGGESVLRNADEILIEFSRDFHSQRTSLFDLLTKSGFAEKKYTKEELSRFGINYNNLTFNQVWKRKDLF